jgi:DUF1009 family protein
MEYFGKEIYAFINQTDGGLVAVSTGMGMLPCVFASKSKADEHKHYVASMAKKAGYTIEIRRYTNPEVVEVLDGEVSGLQ